MAKAFIISILIKIRLIIIVIILVLRHIRLRIGRILVRIFINNKRKTPENKVYRVLRALPIDYKWLIKKMTLNRLFSGNNLCSKLAKQPKN